MCRFAFGFYGPPCFETWATSFDGKHASCPLVTGQFWLSTSNSIQTFAEIVCSDKIREHDMT